MSSIITQLETPTKDSIPLPNLDLQIKMLGALQVQIIMAYMDTYFNELGIGVSVNDILDLQELEIESHTRENLLRLCADTTEEDALGLPFYMAKLLSLRYPNIPLDIAIEAIRWDGHNPSIRKPENTSQLNFIRDNAIKLIEKYKQKELIYRHTIESQIEFPKFDKELFNYGFRNKLEIVSQSELIKVYCDQGLQTETVKYLKDVGVSNYQIIEDSKYMRLAAEQSDTPCIVVSSYTTDSKLREKMFAKPTRKAGLSLINDVYLGESGLVIGANLNMLRKEITKELNKVEDTNSPLIFQSQEVKEIFENEKMVIHALGPMGTNIQQVAVKAREELRKEFTTIELPAGMDDPNEIQKSIDECGSDNIILVYNKVTPDVYSGIANELSQRKGNTSYHSTIMCCVYNKESVMKEEYEKMENATFLAANLTMPLDQMCLVKLTKDSYSDLVRKEIRIATHPTPKFLVDDFVGQGATWVESSSNSAAADDLLSGKSEFAIVTYSAVIDMIKKGIVELVKDYGQPLMAFNFTLHRPPQAEKVQ
jgi:hypothetical protein